MAQIDTHNDIIARAGGGYTWSEIMWNEVGTATSNLESVTGLITPVRVGYFPALPTLPANVTAYIPLMGAFFQGGGNNGALLLAKYINLGSINLATNVFTDGSAMPTVNDLGVSRAVGSALFLEATTALGTGAATITVTYVDQDGNASEASTGVLLVGSVVQGSGNIFTSLNSPDWGVTDITNVSVSGSSLSGTITLWGMQPLCIIPPGFAAISPNIAPFVGSRFNMLRLGATDQLGLLSFATASTKTTIGQIIYTSEN